MPPCSVPLGVDEPAVPESMCNRVLAEAGDVVIREIGLPLAATLATARVDGPVFYQIMVIGIQTILEYFQSSNILGSRTTPITVRNVRDINYTWIIGMMVSTATFPDPASIPPASLPVALEQVGQRSMAVVQFNTTSPPVDADFDAACGKLFSSPLPKGYKVNMSSSWSPTYVLYSGEVSTYFTSECWAEVHKKKPQVLRIVNPFTLG